MSNDVKMQGSTPPDYPLPVSPGPLEPGRPDVVPLPKDGIDELPDNEGQRPLDDDDIGLDPGRVREETDNAVLDKEQDPR